MLSITRRGLAVSACLATAALAHAAPVADPSAADAPVPTTAYQSAFQHYETASDAELSPDKTWRAAMVAVASQPEHGAMAGMDMAGSVQMREPTKQGKPHAMPMPMPMPKGMKMPMPMSMSMPMPMPMPMPMSGKESAPPMDMHHGHGKEK